MPTLPVRASFVNDEWERYARVLEVGGDVPVYPWTVRAFGVRELAALSPATGAHPWAGVTSERSRRVGRLSLTTLPLDVQTTFNSMFPYGYNDGPVWAGRGLTSVLQGGLASRAGPVSVIVAPLFFRAENTAFTMKPNGLGGRLAFGDPIGDGGLDQPQRFGPSAYQRFDPGNSTIRIDVGPVAAGFTTANDHWGPARDHPMLLGNNAAGFPRVFLGTSGPANVWIGHVQTRIFWGKLFESPYTYMQAIQRYRYATGLAGTFTPRGVPRLELGASRFFHVLWSDHPFSGQNLVLTLGDILNQSKANLAENQIASVFGRYVFPGGFEMYGEYGREDHSNNLRDLELEPDHQAGLLFGFQRVSGRGTMRRRVVRGEVLNTRLSGLQMVRDQVRFYSHGAVGQGHTSVGQVLGSIGAAGGGAATFAVDSYSERGRRTFSLSRIMRSETRVAATLMTIPQAADVMYALGMDGVRFRGRMALTYELTAVYELNRNFTTNVMNVRASSGVRYVW